MRTGNCGRELEGETFPEQSCYWCLALEMGVGVACSSCCRLIGRGRGRQRAGCALSYGEGQKVLAKLFWHQSSLPWEGLAGRGYADRQLGKLFGSGGAGSGWGCNRSLWGGGCAGSSTQARRGQDCPFEQKCPQERVWGGLVTQLPLQRLCVSF